MSSLEHPVPGRPDERAAGAQATFRAIMSAMASPASVHALAPPSSLEATATAPLHPAAAAVLLALADFETSVWLAPGAAGPSDVELIRFETGARVAQTPAEADFAVVRAGPAMTDFRDFKPGTPEYPDRSTTVLVMVEAMESGMPRGGLWFAGPGIRERVALAVTPWPIDFRQQWQSNRAAFPCGVDLIFATRTHIAALPRSARLLEEC